MKNVKELLDQYAKHLHLWLRGSVDLRADKKAVRDLKKVMTALPHFNGPIYRGLSLSQTDMIKMLDGKEVNLINRGLESWSANPTIAMEFSPPNNKMSPNVVKNPVGVLVSKKMPLKSTVVIDFTNKAVRKTLADYMHENDPDDPDDLLWYMEREKELVTTPQCDKCELDDVEVLWLTYRNNALIKALGFDKKNLDAINLVSIQGKNKYKLLPRGIKARQIRWKRKPVPLKSLV